MLHRTIFTAPVYVLAFATSLWWVVGCNESAESNKSSVPVVDAQDSTGVIADPVAFEQALKAYNSVSLHGEPLALRELIEMIGSSPTIYFTSEPTVIWVFKLPDEPAAHRFFFRADSFEESGMVELDTVLTSASVATSP